MYSVGGKLYWYPGLTGRWAGGSQSNLSLKHRGDKNDRTEAALLRPHPEQAGFFGEGNNAGENRRQQEQRETRDEVIGSIREATGRRPQR